MITNSALVGVRQQRIAERRTQIRGSERAQPESPPSTRTPHGYYRTQQLLFVGEVPVQGAADVICARRRRMVRSAMPQLSRIVAAFNTSGLWSCTPLP